MSLLLPQVLRHLGALELAVWDGSPQELFVATKPDQYYPPRPDLFHPISAHLLVDPVKPVVLFRPNQYEQSLFTSL